MSAPRYRRILLKLSGEALRGGRACGIDVGVMARLAGEIRDLADTAIQLAVVIGGGNIFRGVGLARSGIDRVTGDQMGMLATLMNALAMQDALEHIGVPTRVMSALQVDQLCEGYDRRRALRHLENGRVVVFAGGTGNPFFTTDTAASLRAVEIGAELLIKATKVNGIYSSDPVKDTEAVFYQRLSYNQALREGLEVMDAAAIVLCRDNLLPVRVMNIHEPGALLRLVGGEEIGSLVESGE